jgi:predicted DNA-binding protein
MTRKKTEAPAVKTVAARIPEELFEALENYRWETRRTMGGLITQIIIEWADEAGLLPQTPVESDNA